MKEKMKKLFASIAAIILAFGMMGANAVPTMAEGETPAYSITVINTNASISISGKTYYAHKLFDATYSADGTKVAYTISTSNPFYTDSTTRDILDQYFTFGDTSDATTKTVSVNDGKKDAQTGSLTADAARELADALQSHITDTNSDPHETVAADLETATITVPGPGYYIVTGTASAKDTKESNSDVVSGVMLTTAKPTATVNPKADVPTLTKKITKVTEGSGTSPVKDAVLDKDGKAAAAKIGSTVSFELDSKVPDTTGYSAYTYTITDTLSDGLNFVANSSDTSNVVVKINDAVKGAGTDYNITINDRVLTITIHSDVIKAAAKGQDITVTYDATVNENALNHDAESNTASLKYSNNPKDSTSTNSTPDKKTYVVNMNLDVHKVAASSETSLSGAEFRLYRENGSANEYYKWNNKVTWVSGTEGADNFTTGNNGNLTQAIRGLDQGTYFLEETKAPDGYNRLANPIKVKITAEEDTTKNTVTYSYSVNGTAATDITKGTINLGSEQSDQQGGHATATVTVENKAGVELPSSGGIGTTIFYIAGAVVVAGAVVLLITRRRKKA